MQTNKRRFLAFLFVVCCIAIFIKWAEKGFASYGWEDVSPNERFKVEIYIVSEYRVYAKLYDNHTGKLIAESDIVDDGATGGVDWYFTEDDAKAYFSLQLLFDLNDYDTKYKSFIK